MTYKFVVVSLDISITSAPYLRQRVFIIPYTVFFVIALTAFHSIRSHVLQPSYGAAFSSLAFSTLAFLTVPCFPFSHFQSPHNICNDTLYIGYTYVRCTTHGSIS